MPRFGKLLLKGRQRAAVGGVLALCVQHFHQRAFAALPAFTREIEVTLVIDQNGLRHLDPGSDHGDAQHLIDHPPRECEMRGFRLTLLRLGLRGALLHLAAQATEQVEIVADPATHRIEVEFGVAVQAERGRGGDAEGREIDLLLLDKGIGIDLG